MVHEAEVRRHVTLARRWTGLLALTVALEIVGSARGQAPDTSAPAVTAMQSAPEPAKSEADYLAQVHAEFTPENRRYSRIRTLLGFLSPFYAIATSMILLFTGLSARMRDVAHRLFRHRYGRMLVYFTLFTLVGFVLDFPLSWYSGFALEHQFNLSNQSFAKWLIDEGKGSLVGIVALGATGLIALAYAAIDKNERTWWLWLGVGTLPVLLVAVLIQPLFIDPLFNKFTPLKDQVLKQDILALAAKAEIPGRNVYEVDKSQQTKKYNAYVNGFGPSQRIVLWDTTLKGMDHDEILFVMGHEMGHYKLLHLWKGVAFTFLLSFGLFFVSGKMMAWATARYGPRWGFTRLSDEASLPLFISAISLAALIAQPLSNAFSRRIEHEADTFGLEVTHSNDAGARAFIKLGSQNRSDPEPSEFVKLMQYSHPPLGDRIRYAIRYHPWTEDRPNRAFKGGP